MRYAYKFKRDLNEMKRYVVENESKEYSYEKNPDGELAIATIPRDTFKVSNDGHTIYYAYPSHTSNRHLMKLAIVHPDETSVLYEYDKLDRLYHIRYSSGIHTYTLYLWNHTSSVIAAKLICFEKNVVQTVINQALDRKALEHISKSNLVGRFIRKHALIYTATGPAIRAKLESAEW